MLRTANSGSSYFGRRYGFARNPAGAETECRMSSRERSSQRRKAASVWLAVSRLPVSTSTSPASVRMAVTLPNR